MAGKPVVQVDGAKELRRAMRKAGLDVKDLRVVHGKVADVARPAAVSGAPVRTGRLRDSVRTGATQTAAILRAGKAKVPYAAPIHWGWERRNISPNPWLSEAAQRTEPTWTRVYEGEIDRVLDDIADSTRGVR